MPPAVQNSRSGRPLRRPPPRDPLTVREAQELRERRGQMSTESSGEESVTPPETDTGDCNDHREYAADIVDVLESFPGTQLAHGDGGPYGDGTGQCECQPGCPAHQRPVT